MSRSVRVHRDAAASASRRGTALPASWIRSAWLVCGVVAVALIVLRPVPAHAQQRPTDLGGAWMIDRDASEFPREVGFPADFLPGPEPAGGADGGRRGSRGVGGQRTPQALRPQGDDYDSAQRRDRLTSEVRTPSVRLTIEDTPDAVTFTDDRGAQRTFHPDGRSESIDLGGVSVLANARREGGTLIVTYAVADLRQLRYSFARVEARLIVDVQFVERGRGDSVRRVYVPATAERLAASAASGAGASTGDRGAGPGADGRRS